MKVLQNSKSKQIQVKTILIFNYNTDKIQIKNN